MRVGSKVIANREEIQRAYPGNNIGNGVGVLIENDWEGVFDFKVKWNSGSTYYYSSRYVKVQPHRLENK